jgi:hypothetical protein
MTNAMDLDLGDPENSLINSLRYYSLSRQLRVFDTLKAIASLL